MFKNNNNSKKEDKINNEKPPSLSNALEKVIQKEFPEIMTARFKVWADEQRVYNTLAKELLEETVTQRYLADKRGITLPVDAGAKAIELIKAKYFSKMDQSQLVDSFRNLTNRISKKRREDPNYVGSTEYIMDDYWLKGLLQRIADTRYIDDLQGITESQILSGLDQEYIDYLNGYIENRGKNPPSNSSTTEGGGGNNIDLLAIQMDSTKRAAFKAIAEKIGLTTELLNKILSKADIADLKQKVDMQLTAFDFYQLGFNADDFKQMLDSLLERGSASLLLNLKDILSA